MFQLFLDILSLLHFDQYWVCIKTDFVNIWIAMNLMFVFCVAFSFFSFFFFGLFSCSRGQQLLFINSSYTFPIFSSLLSILSLMNSVQDPQISFFNNFLIKNVFHNTIHIFENYFVTVFSVRVFSFKKKISSIQTGPSIYFWINDSNSKSWAYLIGLIKIQDLQDSIDWESNKRLLRGFKQDYSFI